MSHITYNCADVMCDFFGMDASNFRSQVGFDVRTLDSVQEMSQESIRYQLVHGTFLSIFRFLFPWKFEELLSSLDSDAFQTEEKAFLLSSFWFKLSHYLNRNVLHITDVSCLVRPSPPICLSQLGNVWFKGVAVGVDGAVTYS